eukprot:1357879-Rhodomonas_salina.1
MDQAGQFSIFAKLLQTSRDHGHVSQPHVGASCKCGRRKNNVKGVHETVACGDPGVRAVAVFAILIKTLYIANER